VMTFIYQLLGNAAESFGVAAAAIVALLYAIVLIGFFATMRQEIKLRRAERKRGGRRT
jgi:uncharacterized membrane protein YdjX (TVP38/TMEM64 family)